MTLKIEGDYLTHQDKEWRQGGYKYVAHGNSWRHGGVILEKTWERRLAENLLVYLITAARRQDHIYNTVEKTVNHVFIENGEVRTVGGKVIEGK